MILKEAVATLIIELDRFRNVEETGEKYYGAETLQIIKNRIDSLDTVSAKLDILNPIVKAIEDSITVVNMKNIADTLDTSDVEILYKNIISRPDIILANGIFNHVMKNKDRYAMMFSDDIIDSDKENVDNICKMITIERDTVVILYFIDRIIKYILLEDRLYGDLDQSITIPIFKRFMDINIIAETNVYYTEIIAENFLKIDCAIDSLKDKVVSYIKTELDPNRLIEENEILKYIF